MIHSPAHNGSDILVVDTTVEGSGALQHKLRNEGHRPQGQTAIISNVDFNQRRLHIFGQSSNTLNPSMLRAFPNVNSAEYADPATVRQHMRVVINPDHPEATFFFNQLAALGVHNDRQGVYPLTDSVARITAVSTYLRATPGLAAATRVNPPFVKIAAADYGQVPRDNGREHPETARDANRCVMQLDCSTDVGSAHLALARLIECGYNIGSYSLRQSGHPDHTQLIVILHEADNARLTFEKARVEAQNQIGVGRVRIIDANQHLQYVQGVVEGTIAEVKRFVSESNNVVKAGGGHVKQRTSSADGRKHIVTGFARVHDAAELAGKLSDQTWRKNGPVQKGLRRPYDAADHYRENFGEFCYEEFRRLMREGLVKDLDIPSPIVLNETE